MPPRVRYADTSSEDSSDDEPLQKRKKLSDFQRMGLQEAYESFSDDDPVTAGAQEEFLNRVPGTKGLPHTMIHGGGHFVQENAPDQVASVIVDLVRST